VTRRWLDVHRADLRALFAALELTADWSDDDAELVAYMESRWLRDEHGQQPDKPRFTAEQEAAARPIMDRLGFSRQVEPPAGEHDEVLVLGAATLGMYRRLDLVQVAGVRAAALTVLTGPRPHERGTRELEAAAAGTAVEAANAAASVRRDGGATELLDPKGRFPARPGWDGAAHRWQLSLLRAAGVDDGLAAAILFPSEADLAELVLTKLHPAVRLVATEHAPPHEVTNELGQRSWAVRTWKAPGPIPELRVLNGEPVHRGDRPSRPTSISTFDEWLQRYSATRASRRILCVVNQPHIGRVRLELLEHVRAIGRTDLTLDFAGCGVLADSPVNVQLGEIPAYALADR
jgi:hypothetical protein